MAKEDLTHDETVHVEGDTAKRVTNEKSGVAYDSNEDILAAAERFAAADAAAPPSDDIEHILGKVGTLDIEDAKAILRETLEYHEYDYNFATQLREKMESLLEGPSEGQSADDWEMQLKIEAAVTKFYSPYPEVRAVTTPDDDTEMACETIRAHFLGYAWAVIGQFTNSLFASRFPGINLSSSVVQILLYPCGMGLALVLPDWGFNWRGKRVSLNPGPWTYKEQMLSTIIVNVGIGTAYCFSNIQTQTVFYHDKWLTPGYGILLLLSTQLMGIGFSGLLRRFVIYPVETIWPNILPTVALNKALLLPEKKETLNGWRISRYWFFFYTFAGMFLYFWIPGYLFPAIGQFAWMTWIAPKHFNVNVITGSILGLGFNPIPTFDWNYITGIMNPLASPFFAFTQQYCGAILGGLIIVALYYNNTSHVGYLPPNTSSIYDNTGQRYNISKVLRPGTGVLDEEAYKNYSPPFYGAGNLLLYSSFFAFYPLTMVFVILDSWKPLLRSCKMMFTAARDTVSNLVIGVKNIIVSCLRGNLHQAKQDYRNMQKASGSIYDGFDNPLTQLLRAYPEVPDWWFLIIAFISFIFSIIVLTNWPQLDTPVWTIFFVIAINLVFLIPMSYLYAISGSTEGLNVVTELVIGYALPGHPEALMFVKAFGYNINGQADNYISDQKMGFYAKIPPRAMYRGQVFSAIITALVCYAVVNFVDTSIDGICTPDQPQKFTCASGSVVYFSSSVVWGAIGPERVFSQLYPTMKYAFLLGFLLAIVWWTVKRFGSSIRASLQNALPPALFSPLNTAIFKPISWLKHVHPSLFMNGLITWAPYNLSFWTGGFCTSFAFMYYLRRYKTAWWEKYNYVLSAGFTGGMAFSGIIIFFAVQYYPKNVVWWGTTASDNTLDGGADPGLILHRELPAKGYFGPDTWY